jgi:hypothetical protein
MREIAGTGCRKPRPWRLRQRNATAESQSICGAARARQQHVVGRLLVHELTRVLLNQTFLAFDVLQIVERDRRDGRHRLQIAAPLALAPAEGDRRRPVDIWRGGRKHRFEADEHGFGPGQKLFEFVHGW